MLRRPRLRLDEQLRRALRQPPTPKAATIRKKAHAATLAAAMLIVPSACAVYFHQVAERENEPYWAEAAERLWALHLAIIVVAALLWLFERPQLTGYIDDSPSGRRARRSTCADPQADKLHRQTNRRFHLIFWPLGCMGFLTLTYLQIQAAVSVWDSGRVSRGIHHSVGALVTLASALGFGAIFYLTTVYRAKK